MPPTIGIIAEGRGDLAVLSNILKGALGIDRADLRFLRPEYDMDQTDLHDASTAERGSYLYVISDCKNHDKLAEFFDVVDEERLIVIHLDAAEAHRAEFGLSQVDHGNADALRAALIAQIRGWTRPDHHSALRFAIAVMETEAWLLPLYDDRGETGTIRDPKRHLDRVGPQRRKDYKRLYQMSAFARADELSRDLRKPKLLRLASQRNRSLRLFCESLLKP